MKSGIYLYCAFSVLFFYIAHFQNCLGIFIDSQKKICDVLMAYFYIPFFNTVKLKLTVKTWDLNSSLLVLLFYVT